MSRYQGMVLSGRAYTANSGVTQTITLGTSLSTTTGQFAIYNPIGSGVNMVLWKVGCAVGNLPATNPSFGSITIAANTDTTKSAPTGGTQITAITHNFLGNVMGFTSKAYVVAASSGNITLSASPTALRTLYAFAAPIAIAGSTTFPVEIDLGGDFVLAPGATASFHPLGAGTGATSFVFSLSWAEIPLAP